MWVVLVLLGFLIVAAIVAALGAIALFAFAGWLAYWALSGAYRLSTGRPGWGRIWTAAILGGLFTWFTVAVN